MSRSDQSMWYQLIRLDSNASRSLQVQLREALVSAILDGHLSPDKALPSTRELSRQLGVARNTVVLAYQHLLDENYLLARERLGYFVNPDILKGRVDSARREQPTERLATSADTHWRQRMLMDLTQRRNIERPRDWQSYRYPFVYGQIDASLFPINDWRECCRLALRVGAISDWTPDRVDHDDELLVEQILTRVLPRRGVWASPENLLITTGAQNALFLIAQLLLDQSRVVGIEDPCYVDARNIFSLFTSQRELFSITDSGADIDERAAHCDVVYVTPSHQCPTTTTMSLEKRRELLHLAEEKDFVIIEDDYESELNFAHEPTPALKSLDEAERVVYIGSLSKTLAPGLRVGFMVGPRSLIEQARALRRLMYRHPPTNNQLTVGYFLSLGHHDAVMLKISQTMKSRWLVMESTLSKYPCFTTNSPVFGGSSFWVALPESINTGVIEALAVEQGVVIEAGSHYFASKTGPRNYLRLGFSSIGEADIAVGIEKLVGVIEQSESRLASP